MWTWNDFTHEQGRCEGEARAFFNVLTLHLSLCNNYVVNVYLTISYISYISLKHELTVHQTVLTEVCEYSNITVQCDVK